MSRPALERAGVVGLVLAAGAGTRMGRPKALVGEGEDAWLRRAVTVLRDGGCGPVVVVLGSRADEARPLLGGLEDVTAVVADDWADGLGASLAAGLRALDARDATVVVVTLVDLPDLVPQVVARVLGRAGATEDALARASFDGRPGHPVLIGRRHWAPLGAELRGDIGARDYLAREGALLVECGDLAAGVDVDAPSTDPECPRQDSNL